METTQISLVSGGLNPADETAAGRVERAQAYGIDCTDSLTWHGAAWQPGGEFIKKICIKNVTARTLHVRYVLPATKFFFMAFPDPVQLSPGMSAALEVRFRPIRFEEYKDVIKFTTDHGSFKIPIQALLARLVVKVPNEVHFSVVPVNEPTTATVLISNEGEVEAMFEWNVESPFLLTPKTGRVPPGGVYPCTVTVMPRVASVLVATAVCNIQGGEYLMPVSLTAHGKYQQLAVESLSLDWGNVAVGATAPASIDRTLVVRNLGSVRASVDVEPLEKDRPALMQVRPKSFLLQPGQAQTLKLRFNAATAGMYTCERFRISSPGGGAHVINTSARCVGPSVSIARKDPTGSKPSKRPLSLQFGDAHVGSSMTQVVTLTNHSREEALFDLECEDSGVFGFSDTKGSVPGLGLRHLVVRFHPRVAGNYYRRVQCLILNGDPVYVELLGTAFDDKSRPAPLRQRHVDAARLRQAHVRFLAPDALLTTVKAGQASNAQTASEEAEWQLSRIFARSGDRSRAANALYTEYFKPPTDPDQPVALLEDLLEFAATRRGAVSVETKVVHVVNRSAAKMLVQWLVPPSKAGSSGGSGPLAPPPTDFIVVPDKLDLDPGSSAEFRVTFTPTADAYYFCQDVECWVAPKVNRSFRLVDEDSLTPPVCLPLKVMGHTFRDSEAFAPALTTSFGGTASDQSLTLPPCAVGDSVFYTFQLANSGEVPTVYEFSSDPSGVFTLQPSVGMLPVRSFQLITVRFTPRHARPYSTPIALTLNHDPAHTVRVTVLGHGDTPRMLLPDAGTVFIKPTSLGIASHRTVTLRNASRLPLRFELRLPEQYQDELRLSVTCGDILGNGSLDVVVTFAPRRTGVHRVQVPVLVYPLTASETNSLVLLDALAGAGSGPSISELEEEMHKMILGTGATPGQSRAGSVDLSMNRAVAGTGHVPGEPVQRLMLNIVSEGTFGALSFDTKQLDFGAALVHGNVSAPLWLENKSDCTLRYKLDAIIQVQLSSVDLDRDDSGIVEMSEVEAEFESARWYASHRRMSGGVEQTAPDQVAAQAGANNSLVLDGVQGGASNEGALGRDGGSRPAIARPGALRLPGEASLHEHEPRNGSAGTGQGKFTRTVATSVADNAAQYRSTAPGERGDVKAILTFDNPTGVVAAHARVRIELGFSPPIAAAFRFRIFYTIQTDDGQPLHVEAGSSNAADLMSTFSASRQAALAAAAEAEADPRDPAMVDWELEPRNNNELVCDAVGIGSYPAVCIEDAKLLMSRESLLTLFPRHFAGMHNGFAPEKVADKADLLAVLGLGPTAEGNMGAGPTGTGTRAAGGALAAIASLTSNVSLTDTSALSSAFPGPNPPRPSPHDLWVRPGAWNGEAVEWGSAQPEDKGWGGWRIAMPLELGAVGGVMPSPSPEQLPVPSAVNLLAPIEAAQDGRVAARPVPTGAGALWRVWSQFSLRDLNRYLSTRLSEDEIGFNSSTQQTRDPTRLAAFAFEFTPAPLGSPPAAIVLHFRNNGRLPAQLQLQMPHERDIDREPWVEVDEPSADEIQDNELLERRIFGVYPRCLQLLPGQAASVRVHYAYASMINAGAHEIVMLLRVRHGKPVRVLLRGRTLPPTTTYLYCGVPSRVLRLAPVPIGVLPEASPVQSVPLYNPSSVPLRWRVSQSSLRALAAANHGFPILRVLAGGGIIPAGGEGVLQVVFTPLVARTYRLRLDIAFVCTSSAVSTDEAGSGGMLVHVGAGAEGKHAEEAYQGRKLVGGAGRSQGVEADETRALKKLLRTAASLGKAAAPEAPGLDLQGEGEGEGEAADAVEASTDADIPDVGIGVASGQAGFESDYPGILQIRLVAQGYTSGGPTTSGPPLIPQPPTIGLGLSPPLPHEESSPVPLAFESTLSTEVLPLHASATDVGPNGRGGGGRGRLGGRRMSMAYVPPPSASSARPAGLLSRTAWGATAAHDALSDGVYSLSGLDTMSAAVSTGFNPMDAVASLVAAPGEVPANFTGPDAQAAASAAVQLARAHLILSRLAGQEVERGGEGSVGYEPSGSQGSALTSDGLGSALTVQGALARDVVLVGGQLNEQASGPGQARYTATPYASPRTAGSSDLYGLLSRLGAPAALRALYRPGFVPPLFMGAYPPFRSYASFPHTDLPEGLATLAGSWVRFGDVPTRAVQHAVVTLRHNRGLTGTAQLGKPISSAADATCAAGPLLFAFDAAHPLVASGVLRISPIRGAVPPGQAVLVRLTLHAPTQAAVLAADVACIVCITPEEQKARAAALLGRALELRQMLGRTHRGGPKPGQLSTHVSVADKSTVSRSYKLEATARELAWRAAVRVEVDDAKKGKSVYTARAWRLASRGGGPGGDPAAMLGLPGMLPPTTTAGVPRGRIGRPAAGNAVHLLAEEAAGADSPPHADARTIDVTSVDPTVGDERPRMAIDLARVRAAEFGAVTAPHARSDGSGAGKGPAKRTGVLSPTSLADLEEMDVGGGGGGGVEGAPGGLPPAHLRTDADMGQRLMRAVVKVALGMPPLEGTIGHGTDLGLLQHVVSGGHMGGPRGHSAAGSRGAGGSPTGGDRDATNARYVQHRVSLEHDPDSTRRIRIASRARTRMSPPRNDSGEGRMLSDDGKSGEGGEEGARGGVTVDASRLLLPPPPHAALFVHVTGRVCGPVEFLQAYTPAHLAAFYHPGSPFSPFPLAKLAVQQPSSPVPIEGEVLPLPSIPVHAGVVTELLATLVADTATDPLLAPVIDRAVSVGPGSARQGNSGPGSLGGTFIPRVATAAGSLREPEGGPKKVPLPHSHPGTSSGLALGSLMPGVSVRDLVTGGVTFSQLKAAGGDISRVPSRAQARARAEPSSDLVLPASPSFFDCSVPPSRTGGAFADLNAWEDTESALALYECEARETVERVLEAALRSLVGEAVSGAWNPAEAQTESQDWAKGRGQADEGLGPDQDVLALGGRPSFDSAAYVGEEGEDSPGHLLLSMNDMPLDEGDLDEQDRAVLAAMARAQAQPVPAYNSAA